MKIKRNPKAYLLGKLLGKQVARGEDKWKQATDEPARELDERGSGRSLAGRPLVRTHGASSAGRPGQVRTTVLSAPSWTPL